MIEGIASYATSASQAKAALETQVSVAKKAMDQAELEGQATVTLIEGSELVAQRAPPTGDHTGAHVNVHA